MAAHLSPTSFAACQTWQPTISGGLVDVRIPGRSTAGWKKPMPDLKSPRAGYSSCSNAGAWAGGNMNDAGSGLQWLPIVEAKRTVIGLKGSIDAGGARKSALGHITTLTVTSITGCFSGATLLFLYQHVYYLVCLSPTWIIHHSHIGCNCCW